MKLFCKALFILTGILSLVNCFPGIPPDHWSDWDLTPPILLGAGATSGRTIRLDFNEPIELLSPPELFPSAEGLTPEIRDTKIHLTAGTTMIPGKAYELLCFVRDRKGNKTRLSCRLYGHNPRVPKILITELRLRGSGKHPDLVELICGTDGNLAGITVFSGVPDDWDSRIQLPSADVKAGDRLLIHFKPQGIPGEIQETEAVDVSGGWDASEKARDFWVVGGTGLPGNNGILSVSTSPRGAVMDLVFFSNRTSAADTTYEGFGSTKMLSRARTAAEQGWWKGKEPRLTPQDGINPDDSTSTRTLCRFSDHRDTNTAADWYTCPTRGSTFGTPNTDEIYLPKK